MSNEILKAFYYGSLTPGERQMIPGSEAARVSKELSDAEELLARALPPELQSLLGRLTAARGRMEPCIYVTPGARPRIIQYCCYAECNPIDHTYLAR